MSAPTDKAETLPLIDLVRTLAIFLVVQMHLIISTLVSPPQDPAVLHFWLAMARNGVYGVFLFFVVSGFLITRLLDRMPGSMFLASPRGFYIRRIGRIIPLFLVVVALGLLIRVIPHLTDKGWIVGFAMPSASNGLFWLSVFTFSFNWFGAVNEGAFFETGFHWDLLWSLSIEEQFYVFYPWILRRLKNRGKLWAFLIIVCMVGPAFRFYAAIFHPERRLLAYMATPGIFDCIAMGAILYLAWAKWGSRLKEMSWLSRLLTGVGMGAMGTIYFGTSIDNPMDLVWTPTCLASALSIFLLGGLSLKFFQSGWVRALALPGKLSYGIYLLHMIVFYALSPLLQGGGIAFDLILFLAVVALVAWVSNKFFEKPMNRWVRQFETPKRPSQGTSV
jgi:peptidoglycan/LPS O-acetylase OafA/YrhL